jgi:energy-coupling factor transporter ATP-binding protein EcfA2
MMSQSERRRQDLVSHIRETLDLIRQYEDTLRLSSDPQEKRRCEYRIAELRELLAAHEAELSAIASTIHITFVDREDELDQLDVERLRASRSPYVLIGAPAGYGKTTLLKRLIGIVRSDRALQQGWSVRYVEFGRPDGDRIPDLVWALTGQPMQGDPQAAIESVCQHVIQVLASPSSAGRRAVLLIFDAVERLEGTARQWLYALLDALRRRTRPERRELVVVRAIIAGRDVASFWQEYEEMVKLPVPRRIRIGPFDGRAIQQLVWGQVRAVQIDLDDQTVVQIAGEVAYLSGGHPRVARDLVDDLARQSFLIGPVATYFTARRAELLRRYLSPVARELLGSVEPDLGHAMDRLSVFRRVNANTIQALIAAGLLSPDTDEIALLGGLQKTHWLEGASIQEPFYRDRLTRRVLALNMRYASAESQMQHQRLNEIALDLYRGWIHSVGTDLFQSAQRLFSIVEWLFHALQDERIDEHTLRAELWAHVQKLSGGGQPFSIRELVLKEIERDIEVRYLLRRRLGIQDISTIDGWLQSQ